MLLLKKHLVQLVRAGKKRQTIRLWIRPMLRAGQISYTPGLGKMKILSVDTLPSLNALTEADALADGFPTLAALREEIRRIYGDKPTARSVFRIRFDWPIDDAGKKLILHTPTQPTAPRPIKAPPEETRPAPKGAMTKAQREKLRAFLISQKPT